MIQRTAITRAVRNGATALIGLIAMPTPSQAQAVTFADLEGLTVTAQFTYGQTVKLLDAGNRVIKNENRQTMTLAIGPNRRINQQHKIDAVAPDGRELGNFTGRLSAELNKPLRWRHGEMVFLFDNGSLIRLQTFDRGGRKITVSFKRSSSGLDCSVDAPFYQEVGSAHSIETTSQTSGQRVEILSANAISSSCRVAKTAG